MEIDPLDPVKPPTEDEDEKPPKDAEKLLNSRVAIAVALLATFLAICKVKDDNIVQGMQLAQVDKLDSWSFYQARNLREEVAKSTITQLKLAAAGAPASSAESYRQAITGYENLVADETAKKADLHAQADQAQKTYDVLNYRDDQFDLSDALGALAISMFALTALTRKRWLLFASLVPAVLAVIMGLAGLLGWHLHSELLARLLS